MTMVPNVTANMPWNILKDFEPVCQLVATPLLLVVRNDIGDALGPFINH